MPSKTLLDPKALAFKVGEIALDVVYEGVDFINDFVSKQKIEHEYISDSRYSKLIRTGLSNSTLEKSKYNCYKTKISATVISDRSEMLFRNILKSFNSMKGDNEFILKKESSYKNILSSKEHAN